MPPVIEYYFSPISPWTWLSTNRFTALATRHKADIRYRPIDLSRVFPATGGLALKDRAQVRQDYRLVELTRWSNWLEIPLTLHPRYFPVSDRLASLSILAAVEAGEQPVGRFLSELLRAVWVEDRDISNRETVASIARSAGIAPEILDGVEAQSGRFMQITDEAIKVGVFGVPFWIFNGEPFWGQDRLEFLDRAVEKSTT